MNIGKAIIEATNILLKKGIKSSQLDSEILMSKVFKKDRKFIILNLQKKIKKSLFYSFKEFVYQRSCGKPIAYLTGKKNFWSNEFVINQNVLIPRPDTEIIIEQVLKIFKNNEKINFLDIGFGSGCILLSILKEFKNFRGIGVDISNHALKVCKINAYKLGVSNRVRLFKSDIDKFSTGKYDLIIIRHYLEHFPDCEKIISTLKGKLSRNGVIYLEVPDCKKFIDKNIPLYLWEQHRYYFTKSSLNRMLVNTKSEFSSIESYGNSIEPSLCTIITRGKDAQEYAHSREHLNIDIEDEIDIETYKQRWNQLISKNNDKEIIMFGAGHNADRFIQLTNISYSIDKIVDDNPLKVGRYLSGVNKKIKESSYLRNKSDIVILLGCHDRSIKACTSNIRAINNKAKIYSIYDMPD